MDEEARLKAACAKAVAMLDDEAERAAEAWQSAGCAFLCSVADVLRATAGDEEDLPTTPLDQIALMLAGGTTSSTIEITKWNGAKPIFEASYKSEQHNTGTHGATLPEAVANLFECWRMKEAE